MCGLTTLSYRKKMENKKLRMENSIIFFLKMYTASNLEIFDLDDCLRGMIKKSENTEINKIYHLWLKVVLTDE